ncbi:MAG: TetR/AcrR family transcriptional regulator [Acidimicrobiia bacterium]|nr:TetR/AcrR family transcriptional regulator [Acidimicrobiia bacterium]
MAGTPTRLTRAEQREQTRTRLLDAGEELFAERGIASTPIEDIAERAGFSRGAFYSNFADKDALVMAILERTIARNEVELEELFTNRVDAADFMRGLRERETDTSRRALSLEYLLYGMRNPAAQAETRRILTASRQALARLVEATWAEFDVELPIDADTAAKVLEALDDGLDMHRQIDPEGYPLGMYTDVLVMLQDAALALAEKRARGEG